MGRLIYRSLALGLSRSRSCSFILCLSHSVISYRCAHGLMPSGSLDIVILSSRALMLSCCRTLILAYDHDIMLAWHHAPMISCSHNRGVIMILHFPSPTPSCPHAPSLLQSLTCKETLPHCLASRSLIVQVSSIAHFRGDVSRAGPDSRKQRVSWAEDVSKSSRRAPKTLPSTPKEAPRAVKEAPREPQRRSKSTKRGLIVQ